MTFVEQWLLNQSSAFVLVLARVGALVMSAPIFGTRAAPLHARALLAVALALVVTPLHVGSAPVDATQLLAFGRYVASEALLGLLLGLGVMILLSGVQLTGQIISQMGGTALADAFDPAIDENVPVFSQFLYFLTLTMFVLLDGHRLLVEALLDTYVWLPPGQAEFGGSYVVALATLLGQSFLLGVRAAAPAMTALLLATIVLGLIGRTLPQINVLVVGFSVNALLTSLSLLVSIGAIAWAFPQQAVAAIDLMRDAIRAAMTGGSG